MTRTLLVMRHAKSDWKTESKSDHARPLAPRGLKAAAHIGKLLTACGRAPDLVLSSTANRAVSTARIAASAGSWSCEIVQCRTLYEKGERAAMSEIESAGSSHGTVLVLGHEPWVSSLTSCLIGPSTTSIRFPTAAVACVEMPIRTWSEIKGECGQLVWFITPRLVKTFAEASTSDTTGRTSGI